MKHEKYFQYKVSLIPIDGNIVLVGGKFNRKIIANEIIIAIIRMTSLPVNEENIYDYICNRFNVSENRVKKVLEFLVAKGFLIKNKLEIMCDSTTECDKPVRGLGIVTCDRPSSLRESISGYISNAHYNKHKIDFVVVDDSLYSQKENMNILKEISSKYKCTIQYLGEEERASLIKLINCKMGIPIEWCSYIFFPKYDFSTRLFFSAGAVRNCVMATFSTEKFLVADDDSMPVGNYSTAKRQICFSQGMGPQNGRFYKEQPQGFDNYNIDFIRHNSNYLGRSLNEIMCQSEFAEVTRFFNNTPILVDSKRSYHNAHIAFTTNTIQGIPDISVDTLLLNEDSNNNGWYIEETCFDSICSEPLLLTTTVTGIDPKIFCVPFIPIFRNEDVMTSMIYNKLESDALAVNVGTNLLHNKKGGYSAIRSSTSNFYEEIIYPMLLKSMLKPINLSVSRDIVSFGKKTSMLNEYIKDMCGSKSEQMIRNVCEVDREFVDVYKRKISNSFETSATALKDYPYFQTITHSFHEITTSQMTNKFRKAILRYMDLLVKWPEILDVCGELKGKGLFPIRYFSNGKEY